MAIGDHVGELLDACNVVVLIGERPGLSTTASLGAYVTHRPRVGRTDADRNCVSNIHGGGLSEEAAAELIVRLLLGATELGRSGVDLQLDAGATGPAIDAGTVE